MKSVASVQDQVSYKFLTGKLQPEHNEVLYNAYRPYLLSLQFIDENGNTTQEGRDFVEWYESEYVDSYLAAKLLAAFIVILVIVSVFV